MDTRNTDLRTVSREEERRRREEVAANALQQQVDELRHQLREQATRQQRLEEQARAGEAQVGQVRLDLSELRQEVTRTAQLRQIDDQRLRQQVSDVQARVDEPLRPLRTLQAQVNDLGEQARLARDLAAQTQKQYEALRTQIEGQRGEVARALEAARGVREAVESVQAGQATLTRDTQKLSDQIRLVEQEVRRRVATIEQQLDNLGQRIDEVASHRPQLEEGIRQVRDDQRVFQPQIDALVQRDKQQDQHQARAQAQAEERDSLMRQRVEEIREYLAGEIGGLSQTVDDSVAALHARIGEWETAHHEVAAELNELAVRASALAQRDDDLLAVQARGEEWMLRLHLDQAQAAWEALLDRRNKGES
ncbi:MAG: hypothetical protein IT340_13835 [Chloroflexi bacterium]|nr:hypothetical protein [Chloroflexota bacterium]